MLVILTGLVVIVTAIMGMAYFLSERNGSDVRVVWYLYSLTALISFAIAEVAIDAGAIKEGGFFGEYGELLAKFVGFMLDVKKDVIIVASIASLVIVPQAACYILSGLSGNAKPPMLVGTGMSFLAWGVIKSLVVCSSVLFSLGLLCLMGYLAESGWNILYLLAMALYALFLAFSAIYVYRDGEQLFQRLQGRVPALRRLHAWCTRNEGPVKIESAAIDVNLLQLSQTLMEVNSELRQVATEYQRKKGC